MNHHNADPKKTPLTKLNELYTPEVSILKPVKSAAKSRIVAGLVNVRKKVTTYARHKL